MVPYPVNENTEFITIPRAEYDAMTNLIVALTAKVEELTAKVEELTAKANKTSKNSSKPPSSDGPRKGNIKNSRVKSGKTSGG